MTTNKSIVCGLALLILCLCIQLSSQASSFPQSVINEMATRKMRYHHYLWHNVRENWNRFDTSTKNAFKKIGWEPPHPARTYSGGVASAIPDNLSGEDFLYMHRQMIATANQIISDNNDPYGKIQGWTTLPAPGDKDWPVPKSYSIPGSSEQSSTISKWKTDSFYTNSIKSMEKNLKSANYLRKLTLGELGAKIEVTVHSYLHIRFSTSNSNGYRSSSSGTIPYIDKKWDNVKYDWLIDTYSSAVNPLFWKIHGWVDDRIEDWRMAKGLSSIKWQGTWTGGPMSNLGSVMKQSALDDINATGGSSDTGDVMEEALTIFLKSGVPDSSPADLVQEPVLENVRKLKSCKSIKKRK